MLLLVLHRKTSSKRPSILSRKAEEDSFVFSTKPGTTSQPLVQKPRARFFVDFERSSLQFLLFLAPSPPKLSTYTWSTGGSGAADTRRASFHPIASLHRQHSKNMKHNLTACFVHVIFFEAMRPFFSFETRGTTTPPPSERKRPGVGLLGLRTY